MTQRHKPIATAVACALAPFAASAADILAVDAGADQTVSLPGVATLSGSVQDTEAPYLSIGWSSVEGPGEVVFDQPHSAVTTARFSAPGEYRLMLGGYNGYVVYDFVRVTVTP